MPRLLREKPSLRKASLLLAMAPSLFAFFILVAVICLDAALTVGIVKEQQSMMGLMVGHEVNVYIDTALRNLSRTAELYPNMPERQRASFLRNFQGIANGFPRLLVLDMVGNVVDDVSRNGGNGLVGANMAQDSAYLSARDGGPGIFHALSAETESGIRLVRISRPLRKGTEFVGALVGELDMSSLDRALNGLDWRRGSSITVLDSKSRVLAYAGAGRALDFRVSASFQPTPGTGAPSQPRVFWDSRDRLWSLGHMSHASHGIRVFLATPLRYLLRSLAVQILVGLFFLILSLCTYFFFSRSLIKAITEPIGALAKGTEDMARGRRIPLGIDGNIDRYRELSALVNSFNDMQAKVKDREEELILANRRLSQEFEEKVRVENALSKAQRLESLGILAGGIAHDFNNLLGGVFGYVEMARTALQRDGDVRRAEEYLIKVDGVYQRACDLTHQLLTFSKGGEPVKKVFSMSELLAESVRGPGLGEGIKIQLDIAEGLWLVYGDSGQIGQVVDKILVNAAQAMGHSGTIWIRSGNFLHHQAQDVRDERYIFVEFEDEGPGIELADIDKVFDPFFSRRLGHGLGLTVCYSIVRKHGGFILAANAPGGGALFRVELPAARPESKAELEFRRAAAQANGVVVLMDETEYVRGIGAEILGVFGFDVILAKDGQEAIEACRRRLEEGSRVDAAVLDVNTHSGVNGSEAAKKIRRIDPSVRLVASSAYAEDPVISRSADYGFDAGVIKPFRMEDLVKALHPGPRDDLDE